MLGTVIKLTKEKHEFKISWCCSELTVVKFKLKVGKAKEADKCIQISASFPFPAFTCSLNFALTVNSEQHEGLWAGQQKKVGVVAVRKFKPTPWFGDFSSTACHAFFQCSVDTTSL